jgi:hypothetical protein
MRCHHNLEEYLTGYLDGAGLFEQSRQYADELAEKQLADEAATVRREPTCEEQASLTPIP